MHLFDKEKSVRYIEALFESTVEGVFIVDKEGRILRCNATFEKLLGYEHDGLTGVNFSELVYKSDKVEKTSALIKQIKTYHFNRAAESPLAMELFDKKERAVPVRLRAMLVKDKEGDIEEAIGIVEDLRKGEKVIELKVQETEETLRNVLTNSGDAIIVCNEQGCVSIVNEAVLRMLGYEEAELLGKHIFEFSPGEGCFTSTTGEQITLTEEYYKYNAEIANELFEKGRVTHYETYQIRKDGIIVPIEATISLLKDHRRELRGSIALCRDITDRRRAEKKIRETREFLENIFKTSLDGIIVTDNYGFITMVNEAIERMLGYLEHELRGKRPKEFFIKGKEDEGRSKELFTTLMEEGAVTDFRCTFLRSDGHPIDVEMNIVLLKDKKGDITGSLTSVRDITERKNTEEVLKLSEEKYRSIFENANDAIYSTNEEGIILSFNRKAEEIFGYAANEIVGKSFMIMLPLSERERHRTWLEQYEETNNFISREPLEGRSLKKNGQEILMEATYSVIEVGGTKIIYCIIRDVTERKDMETKLLHAEKLKSLGELAGGVAHDFNNRLAAILGRTQLLKMTLIPLPGILEKEKSVIELKEGLEVIERAAWDGAETVRRIQEFARRKEDGDYLTSLDVNHIVEHALEATRTRWKDEAESRGIVVTIQRFLTPLPPVAGSASELGEVFINLINNALDAMPQGGQLILKTFREGGNVKIEVEDNGVGIPRALRERIFDPFLTTKGPQSSGLGLSVSYGIINRHRGTITVHSIEGQGTTFTIILPSDEGTGKKEKVMPPSTKRKKARILVIDDERDLRKLLSDILTKYGHEVDIAADGIEGIELFEEKEFDLVFTDLGMPVMSGWQVAEKVKSINEKVPVVLITGWNIRMDESEIKGKGVDLVIQKPFAIDQMLRLVEEGMILRERFKAS